MKSVAALVAFLACSPVLAGTIEGRVIEVPDGRTVTILTTAGASLHRVRLVGIDIPVKDAIKSNGARESLRRMARGKMVRAETSVIDGKGALVGTVQILRLPQECGNQDCAPLDPGLSQLSGGFATIDKSNLTYQTPEAQKLYFFAEQHAKTNRLGVWGRPTATALRQ